MKRLKVLIINGGGIFGCLPAHFLAMLPTSQQNLEGIDVLSGCSVGGILAAAYAVGHQFALIDDVFQRRAKDCFKKRFAAKINPLACPTYDNDSIDEVIQEMIGENTMRDVHKIFPKLSLIIPALDVTDDKYIVFDNIRHKYDLVPLKKIAGYTSAAPSYFAGRDFNGHCLIDGGLIEVFPMITATTSVKKNLGVPFMNMSVLMLGTGQDKDQHPLTLKSYNNLGLLGIATDVLVPYATLSNSLATEYWGRNMGYGNFYYFNPVQTDGKLDDVKQIPALVKEADKHREEFLEVWDKWYND